MIPNASLAATVGASSYGSEARNVSGFYQGKQPRSQHRLARHSEWLLLAYCHARAAGYPPVGADEFCRRHLPLAPLADRLTTEAVIVSLLPPKPRSAP